MLLRIDAFPHDFFPIAGRKLKSPSPVLYAGPNTVRDGILVKVGRKDGDVVFSDKSVSREHLHLTMVSKKESFDVVLKDMSRFGNFIVKEDNSRGFTTNSDDSETGEDETINGGEPFRAGFNVLSEVTKQHVKNSNHATLKRIELGVPVKIHEMLQENGRVIVQCGQNGSTIVISRVPLQIVFSRLDKTIQNDLMIRLPLIGATTVTFFDSATTHLVAKDRITNAKNLAAWLSETPIVTSNFIQALLDRKNPSDPMPIESDYVPLGDTSNFWNTKPNPKLWGHLTLISLLRDEMESICRAAGAKVVPIYMASGKEAIQLIRDSNCNGAFFVYTAASKYADQISELKRMKVSYVIQTTIASCASNQIPLTDVEGDILGTLVDPDFSPYPSNKLYSRSVEDQPLLHIAPSHHMKSTSMSPEPKKAINNPDEENELDEEGPVKEKSLPCRSQRRRQANVYTQEEETEAPTQSKWRSTRNEIQPEMESSHCDGADIILQQRSADSSKCRSQQGHLQKVQDVASRGTQHKRKQSEEEFDESRQQPNKRERSESVELSFNEDEVRSNGGIKYMRSPQNTPDKEVQKKLLGKDEAGWFTAASSDKKRNAYATTQQQLMGTFDEGHTVRPSAPTHVVKGLIIGKRTNPGAQATQINGAKNFKKFRKNFVTTGKLLTRIHLRSVLPKETEYQRKMDKENHQLQEEQRKADAFFSESGGSIRGHFRPKMVRSRLS